MDILSAVEYIKELFLKNIQPHLGTIAEIILAGIAIIIILRIFLPIIWENVLVSIVKLSDRSTKKRKKSKWKNLT